MQISLCESLERTVKLTDSVTDSLERLTILQIQQFNMYNKVNLENKNSDKNGIEISCTTLKSVRFDNLSFPAVLYRQIKPLHHERKSKI